MKMVSRVVVFLLFVSMACAATWYGRTPPKPAEFAHKKGCYVEEINDVVPYGTTLTPIGQCYRIHCSQGELDYASCGVVGTSDDKCYVTKEDVSKPYPDCCPDVKCEIDNSLV